LSKLLRKQRKRKLEAVKFWKKRFDKISWKRKRIRKRPTLSEVGSGSKKSQEWGSRSKLGSVTLQEELEAEAKKYSIASTSLICTVYVISTAFILRDNNSADYRENTNIMYAHLWATQSMNQ